MKHRTDRSPSARRQRSDTADSAEAKALKLKLLPRTARKGQLSATLNKSHTSKDARQFIAAVMNFSPPNIRFYDEKMAALFGPLYEVGFHVQDLGRRYREYDNALHVWEAIKQLTDPKVRAIVGNNADALVKLDATWLRLKPGKRRYKVAAEREIRSWLGDPFPAWVVDYLRDAAEGILALDGEQTRKIAQALQLAPIKGGRTAYKRRSEEHVQARKALALRMIREAHALGAPFDAKTIAGTFHITTRQAQNWMKEAT